MEKAGFLILRPFTSPDEARLNFLIESLNRPLGCDLSVFTEIRSLFFHLSTSDFDRLGRRINGILIVCLSRFLKEHGNSKDSRIMEFKSRFLSLLVFLNFRYVTPMTTDEQIEILNRQIADSEHCSLLDLGSILRFVKASFDSNEPEILPKVCQKMMSIIFTAKKRLIDSITIEDMTPEMTVPILTLTTISSMWTKFFNAKQTLLPNFRDIMKLEPYNGMKLADLVSLYVLQGKAVSMGPFIPDLTGRDKDSQLRAENVIKCLTTILLKAPHSVSTLIDDSAAILLSPVVFVKQEIDSRLDIIARELPEFFDFRNITQETLHAFHVVVLHVYEYILKRQKGSDELLVRFCKFTTGLLHFRKTNFNQCSGRFNTLYSLFRMPNTMTPLRNSLLSLFIFAFDLGFMEVEQQLDKIKMTVKDQTEILEVFSSLMSIGESYFRLVKFFENIVKMLMQTDITLNRPFYNSIASPLNIIDFNVLLGLFKRALLILMKYRSALQRSFEVMRYMRPVNDLSEHYKQCSMQIKNIKAYERARSFHLHSAQDIVAIIGTVPPGLALLIWDAFFEDFFKLPDNIQFDSCTFRAVISDSRIFSRFLRSLVAGAIEKLRSGFELSHLIHSLHILFEKLGTKPTIPPRNLEGIEKIHQDGTQFLTACKELIPSSQYCSDILGLMRVFISFMDFICINKAFSPIVIKEQFVAYACRACAWVSGSTKHLLYFILFCSSKNADVLKSQDVITTLINSLTSDPEQSLQLLKTAEGLDAEKFYQHPMMLKMYQSLILLLGSLEGEAKEIAIGLLHEIPMKDFECLDSVCSTVLNQKIVSISRGDCTIDIDTYALLRALRYATAEHPENELLWKMNSDITFAIADTDSWTIDRRRMYHQVLLIWLSVYEKDPKEVMSILRKLATVESVVARSHIVYAVCSRFNRIPIDVSAICISFFDNEETFKGMIQEFLVMTDLHLWTAKSTLANLCIYLARQLKLDVIEPITFATLVHRTVVELYSAEWIVEQRSDEQTNLFELNFLSEELQKMIAFTRKLMRQKKVEVTPLLNLIRSSTSLLPILVVVEMISESNCRQEVIDFVEGFLEDPVVTFEYGRSRLLGPLMRVFPFIMEHFEPHIMEIVRETNRNLPQLNRKQQGLFLLLLNPVLALGKTVDIDYKGVIGIVHQFLGLQHPLLKCQAQMVLVQLYRFGSTEVQRDILQIFEETTRRDYGASKGFALKWLIFSDVAFTFFRLMPSKLVEVALQDLESIKSLLTTTQGQSGNVGDFYKACVSLINFMSSCSVVRYIVENGLFQRTAKLIVSVYTFATYLRRTNVDKFIVMFFAFAGHHFVEFFNSSIGDVEVLECFATLISNTRMRTLFSAYHDKLELASALINGKECSYERQYLAMIICNVPSALSTNVSKALCEMCLELIKTFNNSDFLRFKPLIFQELVGFFAKYSARWFLQLAFCVVEYHVPLLISMFIHFLPNVMASRNFGIAVFQDLELNPRSSSANIDFIEFFFVPCIKNGIINKEQAAEFIYQKFSTDVFLSVINTMNDAHMPIETSYDAYDLYHKCTTDEMRLQALLYWSRHTQVEHFIEMFGYFGSFFNVHLPNELRAISENLRIPNDLPNIDGVFTILLELMNRFTRYPTSHSILMTIYANNRSVFEPIKDEIITIIQEQVIGIEMLNSKQKMASLKPTFVYVVKFLPKDGQMTDNELAIAHHLVEFANKMFHFTKEEEHVIPDYLLKMRGDLLKSVVILGKLFGSQAEFNKVLVNITCDMYAKAQGNHATNAQEPMVFDMLLHIIPDVVDSLIKTSELSKDGYSMERLLDVLVNVVKMAGLSSWPLAMSALVNMAQSETLSKIISEKLSQFDTPELMLRVFHFLWMTPPDERFRVTKLIPLLVSSGELYNNMDLPIDTLLCDSMLSFALANPQEYALESIFRTFSAACTDLSDNNNRIFVSKVWARGLGPEISCVRVRRYLLSFLEVGDAELLTQLFMEKPSPLTGSLFNEMSITQKLPCAAHIATIKEASDTLGTFLLSLNPKEVMQISKIKEIPIAIFLAKLLDDASVIDVLRFVIHLPGDIIKCVYKTVKNNIDYVFDKFATCSISTSFGLAADQEIEISLADWSTAAAPSQVYDDFGLVNRAFNALPSSIGLCTRSAATDLIDGHTSAILERAISVLGTTGQTSSFYIRELNSIIDEAKAVVSASNYAPFSVVYELKNVVGILSSSKVVPNIFSLELSPVVDPSLHEQYTQLRELASNVITRSFDVSKKDQFMEIMKKREICWNRSTQKAYKYHFTDDSYRVMKAYQEALLSGQFDTNLLKKALRNYPNSDTIMSASLGHMDVVSEVFHDGEISYRWSHHLAEIIDTKLASSIHDAFKICIVNKHPTAYFNINTRNIKVFLEILNSITNQPLAQLIKRRRDIETNIANFARGEGPKPTNHEMTEADNLLGAEQSKSLILVSHQLQPIAPPFVDGENSTGILFTATVNSHESSYISAIMLLSSGKRIPYSITPHCAMDVRLALFNNIMTGILRKSPEKHARGQVLASIHGMELDSGFYISQTSAIPLIHVTELEKLVDLRRQIGNKNPASVKDPRIESNEKTLRQFVTTKEASDWLWHFGVRFGGIIAEQLLFGWSCPSPFDISVDEKTAAVSFAGINTGSREEYMFPRLCGAMRKYLNKHLLNGPLRHGIISASNSLSYRKMKVAFHATNVLGMELSEKEFANIERFSILQKDPTYVDNEINAMINRALDCKDIYVLPWI